MIHVVGEALVDLVIDPDGQVVAALGGAPFNTARACGRLGVPVAFVGALSDDRFGSLLRARLVDDGVVVDETATVSFPTTLAAAELDERGAASYRFYLVGTSAPALTSAPRPSDGDVLFTGGLALVLEPLATTVEGLVADVPAGTIVVLDVNCRPLVVPDRAAYVERVLRIVGRSDLVKVSDEDLEFLFPGTDPIDGARALLDRGPAAILVTRGAGGVHVLTVQGERVVTVEPVDVVDTIGAGDTFGGALIAWLTGNRIDGGRLGDPDVLVGAVRAATVAAGIVCARRGADPPWSADLPPDWWS